MMERRNAIMNNEHYDASDIQVLEGLEAVRKRPGMYIGSTSARGLHHLVWEIVDNAIDESLAGYCDDIEITINKDGSVTVKDDGRGIPVGIHPKTGLSTVETVYTVLHAGGKFGGGGYKVSGGLHGVGASVVNALSKWVEVTVYKEGKVHNIKFANGGKTVKPLTVIGECSDDRTGTTVTFMPDETIFTETIIFDYETLRHRAQELAFLNKGLRIMLMDDRDEKKDTFVYEGGIKEYVELLHKNKNPIHDTIVYVEGVENNVSIEVAFQYNDGYNSATYSFVNNITTPEGGTHEDGVKNALSRIINNYARTSKLIKDNDEGFSGDDVREGITMIVSAKVPEPQFEGQTKTKLGNSEVRKIAANIFGKELERFLLEHPDEAKLIVEKCTNATRARLAAKRARELTRRKGGLEVTNFWGKLTDCSSKDATISEMFIVEGDSAAGSAVSGRDPITQAILPIRGKILNVEKARLDRILANEEIRTMITALGTGIGEEFDISKLRYYKIIIMTDADVDGAHIRTLLLTLFYRYFRPLIENGHIYAAQPPLYSVKHGKTIKYVLNDDELNEYLSTLPENAKTDIGRMKGLGEMNPEELRETTMGIDKRVLKQINMEDAMQADEIFQLLMGEEVEPRRKFIEENALNVMNLDV
ncbi:MAG: DNA topoisomerase (ATP-hydrolyzing) subunit B [Bacilli bacterium]|nr:DNA topoisomerase (ATP-hydrolyzing) subunit B [Bacilli bacterium]